MPLRIEVANAQQRQRIEHRAGPLELGRGPEQKWTRVVIDDMFVSRDQLRIEELADGRVRLENLSSRNAVDVSGGHILPAMQSREVTPPITLAVGKTRVVIDRTGAVEQLAETQPLGMSILTALDIPPRPPRSTRPLLNLHGLPNELSLEGLTQWLETIIELQQAPAGSAQFFDHTARALIELIGLDLALVLIRQEKSWAIAGSAVANDRVCVRYSRTLLEHVVAQPRTFYQDLNQLRSEAVSLVDIESAVVSPVFGVQGEVVGALYGVGAQNGLAIRGGIEPLEAQLVQLLAGAVGTNLICSLAARTRVQFEQFFSSELVRELERDPKLLEGRSEEVTVLFSDLRGFTALSEKLGAEKTCQMIRDMMERLSVQIVEHGGVIVDYAGDGILAMWNAPARQADHAARACRAALDMLAELPALNARWSNETNGAALALGIGINTGLAQVGNTGSSRKFKYGPHGHTVNLASRVQDATKHLGLPLLVPDHTRRQLPESLSTRRLGRVRLPGVKDPVMLHEVRGDDADPEWRSQREIYERALALYEGAQWSQACETLMPLVAAASSPQQFDAPTLKLMRRAWECLESRLEHFEPIIEATAK